jgi:hypothetical protein
MTNRHFFKDSLQSQNIAAEATTEVASSHVPMLSHPDVVMNVIRAAAKAVQGATATE